MAPCAATTRVCVCWRAIGEVSHIYGVDDHQWGLCLWSAKDLHGMAHAQTTGAEILIVRLHGPLFMLHFTSFVSYV